MFTFGGGSWSSELDSKDIKAIIIGLCDGDDEYNMGFTIESIKRVMRTRKKPVMMNEEIKGEIAKKVKDLFIT